MTLDGGHAGNNVLVAGAGDTREHGWFGHNPMIGGAGQRRPGRPRRARQLQADRHAPTEIFAGKATPGADTRVKTLPPPQGTFYKSVNGKPVPIPTPSAGTKAGTTAPAPTHHPKATTPRKSKTTTAKKA